MSTWACEGKCNIVVFRTAGRERGRRENIILLGMIIVQEESGMSDHYERGLLISLLRPLHHFAVAPISFAAVFNSLLKSAFLSSDRINRMNGFVITEYASRLGCLLCSDQRPAIVAMCDMKWQDRRSSRHSFTLSTRYKLYGSVLMLQKTKWGEREREKKFPKSQGVAKNFSTHSCCLL